MDGLGDLADRVAIRALVDGYAAAADRRDAAAFGALFTPDATLVGSQLRYEGADQIATIPAKLDRYERTFHLVANHVVDLAGDTASGETYCAAHHLHTVDGVQVDRVLHIRYLDDFVRTDDGWRISCRRLEVDWIEDRPVTLP